MQYTNKKQRKQGINAAKETNIKHKLKISKKFQNHKRHEAEQKNKLLY